MAAPQHGREQFSGDSAEIRADYAVKERAVLEREDVSAKAKKQLQAFLRMDRIAETARAEGYDLGNIARRIDGKGVIIFSGKRRQYPRQRQGAFLFRSR